jgi:MSHA biogenesis protein MshJ
MSITLAFRQQISKLEEQVNARNLRERAFLLTAVVLLIFLLWRNLILNYLSTSTDQIIANKERLSTQINLMQGQIENLSAAIKNDSTNTLEQKLKISVSKNISIKEKINQYISGLVTSGEMISVLKNLLTQEEHIKIEKIESLDDHPIFSEKSDIFLYNKGIQLELEGDYLSTVLFLEKLEKSDAKILWDTLTYQVTQYPFAKIIVVVHTLGTQKGWLHV